MLFIPDKINANNKKFNIKNSELNIKSQIKSLALIIIIKFINLEKI